MSAVDFGRQRHLLAQAQALTTDIRSSPLDPDSVRQSFPKLVELVRLAKRFIESTASLPSDGTRAMWEQRGQWLREEVAALAQERIYSADQQQYWLNLVQLLFAGADACDRVLREKVETNVALQAASEEVVKLKAQVAQLEQQQQQQQQSSQVSPEAAEEVLQLRSKAVVLQQELDKHQGQAQALSHQLQLLIAEQSSLRSRVDELRTENATLQELADGRLEVIQTMMFKAEGSSTQSSSLAQDNAQLQAHCKTLSINLETNAQVIEKLIELNAELMDNMNRVTATKHKNSESSTANGSSTYLAVQGPQQPADLLHPGSVRLPDASSSANSSILVSVHGSDSRLNQSTAISYASTAAAPPPPIGALPPLPLSSSSAYLPPAAVQPAAGMPSGTPTVPPQRPPPQLPSFAAALEAFLTAPPEASKADADRLAQVPSSTASVGPAHAAAQSGPGPAATTAAAKQAAGRRGVGGAVLGLFSYVAGSEAAKGGGAGGGRPPPGVSVQGGLV